MRNATTTTEMNITKSAGEKFAREMIAELVKFLKESEGYDAN